MECYYFYSVHCRIDVANSSVVINELVNKMHEIFARTTDIEWPLKKRESEEIKPNTVVGCLKILFAGRGITEFKCETSHSGNICLSYGFKNTRGWNQVMYDVFKELINTRILNKDSFLEVESEDDYWRLSVTQRGGKEERLWD